jgi:ATP-dependent Zn protease
LKENKYLKNTEIFYVNTPKPNIVFELFNKVIYYLLLFIIAKTVISTVVGALVTGVSQATDTGSPFRIIKSTDKEKHVKTKLNDIAGYDDTKKEVQEYIAYLKSRDKYIKIRTRAMNKANS